MEKAKVGAVLDDPVVHDMEAVELGFVASHAPQIYRRPPEEDPAQLDRIHTAIGRIAERVEDARLDALIVVGDDHLHNLFLDLLPPFTIYTGMRVRAAFSGQQVECNAKPDVANDLLDNLLSDDFDPAFSQDQVLDHAFMIPLWIMKKAGLRTPVIPVVINAYVPPQPSMGRCYALGRAIARWSKRTGTRVGVLGSGGMSHYPGTDKFHEPDVESDRMILSWLQDGQIDRVVQLSVEDLDRLGQGELLCWAVALGARGPAAKVEEVTYWDSGHCGYAVLSF